MSDESMLPSYGPDQARLQRLEDGKPKDAITVNKPAALKMRVVKVKAHKRKLSPRAQPDRRNPTYY